MSNEKVVVKTLLTGGTSSALDSISSTSLTANDIAFVYEKNIQYTYIYDSTDISAEDVPYSVKPDNLTPGVDPGLWILNSNHPVDGQNLLLNPEFTINQREYPADGVDTLTDGEYGHDMWVNKTGSTQKYFKDGTDSIQALGCYIGQKNDFLLAHDGQKVTFSLQSGAAEIKGIGISTWTTVTAGLKNAYTWTLDAADNGGFFMITGLVSPDYFKYPKIELGIAASPFRLSNESLELLKCQRYFWTSGLIGNYDFRFETTKNASNIHISESFPVEMRAVPTCSATLYDIDSSAASSVISVTASKRSMVYFQLDAAPGVGTFRFGMQITANASY